MKIIRTGKAGERWTIVEVTPGEAIELVESLAKQLRQGPNVGRLETRLEEGGRFTIAVTEQPKKLIGCGAIDPKNCLYHPRLEIDGS